MVKWHLKLESLQQFIISKKRQPYRQHPSAFEGSLTSTCRFLSLVPDLCAVS